jgi:hypothetical protein
LRILPLGFLGSWSAMTTYLQQVGLARAGGGAGEQDQAGAGAGRVGFEFQGLAEPDDGRGGMPGLAELVAVHAQHRREQARTEV